MEEPTVTVPAETAAAEGDAMLRVSLAAGAVVGAVAKVSTLVVELIAVIASFAGMYAV